MNKPAKQTVIVPSVIPQMMNSLPITRLKGFGGKLGKELIEFYCSELSLLGNFYEMTDVTVGEFLSRMSEGSLNRRFGDEKARHILNMCRGEGDDILVDDRHLSKSVICGKTFRGTHMHTFANLEKGLVMKWFEELASELVERVEREEREHERLPRIVTVSSNLRVFPTVMSVNQAAEEKNYRTATKFDVSKQDKWIPGSDAVRVAAQCESMMKKAIKASMGLRIPTQQTGRVMLSTIYLGAADFYDLNTSSMNKLSGYFPSVSKIEKMDEKENQKSQIIVEDEKENQTQS
jgi:nucleotidyltransferase/DNA polymerase involved in DNA repair